MSQPLTVAIVGCGEITAKRRAEQFQRASGVEIGVSMDVEPSLANDVADRVDCSVVTEYDELLEMDAIDVVYLATPHHLHAPQAIAGARAGHHVLVEKPIAVDLDSATAVIDACQDAGVTLGVCDTYRYRATYRRARELIETGYLGEIVGTKLTVWARKPDAYWDGGYTGRVETDWRKSMETSGGGILSTNVIHNVDAMNYLTGLEPERIACEYDTFASPVDVEDFSVATIRYKNGAIGIIEASSFLLDGPPEQTVRGDRVYGTDGELVIGDPLYVRTNEATDLGAGETFHELSVPALRPAGERLIEAFAESVHNGTEPPVSGEDGRDALELVTAAYTAGNTGSTVSVPQTEDDPPT